jgi:hypothetical protein
LLVKTRNKRSALLGLCAALSAFGAAAADDVVIPASAANDRPAAPGDPAAAPMPRQYDQVTVINGGVDLDQAAAIKRMAPQYKLRVEISGRGGDYYVADRLQLMKQGALLAEVPDAGPWLLFDVPAGHYTLVGQFANQKVQRDVTVAGAGTTVHWVVPSSVQ